MCESSKTIGSGKPSYFAFTRKQGKKVRLSSFDFDSSYMLFSKRNHIKNSSTVQNFYCEFTGKLREDKQSDSLKETNCLFMHPLVFHHSYTSALGLKACITIIILYQTT